MTKPDPLPLEQVRSLRQQHYNATVTAVRHVHEDLLVMRVRPDGEMIDYEPGQYATLGLGRWEPRIDGIVGDAYESRLVSSRDRGDTPRLSNGGDTPRLSNGGDTPRLSNGGDTPRLLEREHLIRRAYSISCPMLDEEGRLARCADCPFLEFYVTLIRKPVDDPPSLTPRLFALDEGDRLFVGRRPHGKYTLEPVGPEDDVIFLATGTGEAPHNAMIAELLSRGHRGRIAAVTSVRYRRDLAYRAVHKRLGERFENYRYAWLTTREPYNIVPGHPQYVGKQHLQDYVASGRFSKDLDWPLQPEGTHVYLCGNPAMIGLPQHDSGGNHVFPEPPGMVEVLVQAGFTLDEPHRPGNVHFEKYW